MFLQRKSPNFFCKVLKITSEKLQKIFNTNNYKNPDKNSIRSSYFYKNQKFFFFFSKKCKVSRLNVVALQEYEIIL